MNIKEAKEELKNTLRAYHGRDGQGNYKYPLLRQRPILLMGPPGIGKTAIVEQVAEECGVGLVAYTMTHHTRQSAIGLPQIMQRNYEGREMSVTEYTLSEIIASVYDCMERTGKKEGILFIDEINCVSETLAPVMLQFLQNKTFGSHRVPEGWMIVAAGNPAEYNRSVREFDIVTLDRVRRIDVSADCDVWLEYAWEKGIHGAILAYLNLKKDHFYRIEADEESKKFVTARGWEDLSELLKSYEELGVAVTEDQIGQFLQYREIAGDFAACYQLYQKYGGDYGVAEILEGSFSKEAYQDRVGMARRAGFDERFTVTGLLADGCGSGMAEFEAADRKVELLYEWLLQLKEFLKNQSDMLSFGEFIQQKKDSLKTKERMELISGKEAACAREVISCLEAWELTLKKEYIRDPKAGFLRIKEFFERQTKERKQLMERQKQKLGRAIQFVADGFGEDQEMILLISILMRSRRAMSFISTFGCEEFFRYSKILLQDQTERELQEACRKLLEEPDL